MFAGSLARPHGVARSARPVACSLARAADVASLLRRAQTTVARSRAVSPSSTSDERSLVGRELVAGPERGERAKASAHVVFGATTGRDD